MQASSGVTNKLCNIHYIRRCLLNIAAKNGKLAIEKSKFLLSQFRDEGLDKMQTRQCL